MVLPHEMGNAGRFPLAFSLKILPAKNMRENSGARGNPPAQHIYYNESSTTYFWVISRDLETYDWSTTKMMEEILRHFPSCVAGPCCCFIKWKYGWCFIKWKYDLHWSEKITVRICQVKVIGACKPQINCFSKFIYFIHSSSKQDKKTRWNKMK